MDYLSAIIIDAEERIHGIQSQLDTLENTQGILEENQKQILHNQARILRDIHVLGLYLREQSNLIFKDYDEAGEYRDIIDGFYADDNTLRKRRDED